MLAKRSIRVRLVSRAAPVLVLAGLAVTAAPARAAVTWETVVVSGTRDAATVRAAVAQSGGRVTKNLPIVNGVTAVVPARAVPALRRAYGVRAVTPDAKGRLMGVDPVLGYDVTEDDGSVYNVAQVTHAKDVWGRTTGKGVDVALIDSGVSPVNGLRSGNVMHGPDLSFESQSPQQVHLDTFGHGTHMASIIAGRDAVGTGLDYANAPSTHRYNGIAPDARLISVKVASNDGATDVSQIIAAIDWVVAHKADPGFNIRVLNLSYGTDSKQDPSIDPLCFAVENAWRAGIVVVVAGGNDGVNRNRLASPAQDPLVIAVGADDPMGTDAVDNDTVPAWVQPGTIARRLDLVAPGVHVLGLRVPGSRIDQTYPSAVVGDRFFRGSGTSQSTAVVSGLAALYVAKYPATTPDQVKRALTDTAVRTSAMRPWAVVPDMTRALAVRPTQTQAATGATGTGSLEAARGSVHVTDGTSTLTGEQDIFGKAWDSTTWAALSAAGASWNGGDFNGSTWTGSAWSGNAWSGAAWSGNAWSGNAWSGTAWSGTAWSGNAWSGNAWSGNAWSGNAWSGNAWSGSAWSGTAWSSEDWG
jgi:serine protease AprX